MKRYEKYIAIPSTVSPEMPKAWTAKKLKFVLSYSKGKQPSQMIEEPIGDPYATMDYLRGRDCILQYPVSTDGLVHIDSDSLLVLWDGANAGEFLRGKAGYLGSTMAVIKAGDNMDKSYLFYLLKGSEALSKMIAGGTTIPHFSPTFFDEVFAIPSYDEQQKIAAFLDYKTGKIDRLTEILTARIYDLKKYRQSVISEVVTRGLDKSAKLKYSGVDWIGDIPREWKVAPLKTMLRLLTDGTHQTPTYISSGIPFISIKDMSSGFIDFSDTKFISEEEHRSLSQHAPIEKGDVIFSRIGTLGVFIKVDTDRVFDIFVSLGLMKIIPGAINTDYLVYYLSSTEVKNYINLVKAGEGTSAAKFNLGDVKETKIIIPPASEQQRIVDYLNKKIKQIDDTIAATEQQIKDLQAYRISLISEAVTGQIDVRDWTAPV